MTSLLLLLALAGDLEAAEKALAEGRARDAVELVQDLADGEDADGRANAVLGRAFLALNEYEAAVEPLLRASDADPEDRLRARDAALACWGSATGAFERAYFEDALRMAQRSQDPVLLADLHHAMGDYEEALRRYAALEESAAPRLHVLRRTAECLQALGRTEEARGRYTQALEEAIAGNDLGAAYECAFAADRAGRLVAWLDGRVAAAPDDVWLRLYRGYARLRLFLYAEAIEDLRLAVAARPDDLEARGHLCRALLEQGMRAQDAALLAEGEQVARAILDSDPAHAGAWDAVRWLAWHAWNNRNVPRSQALLGLLHGLDPSDFDVAMNFAAMSRRLGLYADARAAYDTLLEIYPEDPVVLNDLGILLDGQGDRAGAAACWQKVLEIEPQNLNALENLLTDAWERGDREACTALLSRGLAAARAADSGPVARWQWFADRLAWAPSGHGA